jgi:glycine hydroxymethyltransferase
LGKVEITVNKNTVPNEKRSPFVTSGIRLGTPAITSRGLGRNEMAQIATWIREVFDHLDNEVRLGEIKAEVNAMAGKFPLYPEWS